MIKFKYNTSICLICKDENPYINEWLEYHIGIGINHFYIYDNMSTVPITIISPITLGIFILTVL